MWHSEDDVVKDLAVLNDFGDPGDKKPYKMLYSAGRGSKIKKKPKASNKILDETTGETYDAKVLDFNEVFRKCKGRGRLLANRPETSQILQQLRLARPMGSGDEAVELFYGKSKPAELSKNNPNTSDSEESEALKICNIEPGLDNATTSDLFKQKPKAIQSSRSQNNIALNNLLAKVENLNCGSSKEFK